MYTGYFFILLLFYLFWQSILHNIMNVWFFYPTVCIPLMVNYHELKEVRFKRGRSKTKLFTHFTILRDRISRNTVKLISRSQVQIPFLWSAKKCTWFFEVHYTKHSRTYTSLCPIWRTYSVLLKDTSVTARTQTHTPVVKNTRAWVQCSNPFYGQNTPKCM